MRCSYSSRTRIDTTTRASPVSSCMYRRASSSTDAQPPRVAGRRTTIGDGAAARAPNHVCASRWGRSTGWTMRQRHAQ